ncbi:hypothetical protein [Actinomadura decatromicini]|uniref:Uncharacterized protein n=1 Tax=Actinomadura decatromicini TaxID=2604572 RepID=A0A5D3F846_9ACTN|nr:hypothetical protein [Actinomadura decatromicini]TYK44118.1 hypothetical protein FXF68_36050 [Actinomadura decatromicini]
MSEAPPAGPGHLAADQRAQAHQTLTRHLQALAARHAEIGRVNGLAMNALHHGMHRLLAPDDRYRSQMAAVIEQRGDRTRPPDLVADRRAHRLGGDVMTDERLLEHARHGLLSGPDPFQDPHLDIYAAPYADHGTYLGGTGRPHHTEDVWASRATGEMGWSFQIFPEPGTIVCSSAIWVDFMRITPGHPPGQGPAGTAQVRTYTPYEYLWNNQSDMAVARSSAHWGIYVLSWDLHGGPPALEQDHIHPAPVWDDLTGWNWVHANPGWPSVTSDHAFPGYGPPVPTFPIRPERLYSAAIWCWTTGDAIGQAQPDLGSYALAALWAQVRMIVIAQT